MSRYIDSETLQNIRSFSAFDYMKNYHPDLLIKNGRTDYYHRYHDPCIFLMANGIGGQNEPVVNQPLII